MTLFDKHTKKIILCAYNIDYFENDVACFLYEEKEESEYQKFKKRLDSYTFDVGEYHWNVEINERGEDSLYFIIHDSCVKIGRTKDITKRIKQLKTSFSKNYKAYVFPNKGLLERKFHHIYSDFRLEGEWFKLNIVMLDFLDRRLEDGSAYEYNETLLKEQKDDLRKLSLDSELKFGKHQGRKISEIIENNPSYMKWLEENYETYEKKFNKEVREIVSKLS